MLRSLFVGGSGAGVGSVFWVVFWLLPLRKEKRLLILRDMDVFKLYAGGVLLVDSWFWFEV